MNANNLIESQPTRRGTLLTLPRRVMGKARIFGWLPVVVGLLSMLLGLGCMASILPNFFQNGANIGALEILFIVFAASGSLFPIWIGLKVFALGIAILRDQTYSKVEITNKNLVCYESFYGFYFKRKVSSLPIKELFIREMAEPQRLDDDDPNSRPRGETPEFLKKLVPDDLWALTTTRTRLVSILAAYPAQVINEAASLIKKELEDVQFRLPSAAGADVTQNGTHDAANSGVTITDTSEEIGLQQSRQPTSQLAGSLNPLEADPRGEQSVEPAAPPANSALKVTQQDGIDVYEVPAKGWRKVGLYAFIAIVWNGFLAVSTCTALWDIFQQPQVDLWTTLRIIGIGAILWIIGLGLAGLAWNMANRSAMIGVQDEQMFIERKTIFGTKWNEFNQSKIHSISVQNSGATVNDVPIKHLRIETEDQPPMGMFANLTNEELHWLAARLKQSLNFKWKNRLDISTAFNDDGDIIVPEETRLLVDRSVGQTTVKVPAASLGKLLASFLFFIVTLALTTGLIWFLLQRAPFDLAVAVSLFAVVFNAITFFGFLYSTRSWNVVISPECLTITRRWLFGTKQMTFERDSIKRVCLGTTGLKVAGQSHYQLVVHTRKKKNAMKLMGSWKVKELKYVGAQIYKGLEMELKPTTTDEMRRPAAAAS